MEVSDAIRIARRTIAETECITLGDGAMYPADPNNSRHVELAAAYNKLAEIHPDFVRTPAKRRF